MSAPVLFRWTGEVMEPSSMRFARDCNKRFVVGEQYPMDVLENRSGPAHRHYFACIHEVWANLPEGASERFPTSEHLRKFALIKTGYRDERTIVAASKAEAQRVAGFIRPMDDFSVVVTEGASVTVYTAKSQNMRAMDRATFAASKDAVLGYLSQLLDVSPATLEHAGASA